MHTAGLSRAVKDGTTGCYNGAPPMMDEPCIVDADSEELELPDDVLVQMPVPKSPLTIAADSLGTMNAVVGANIFQSCAAL